MVQRKKFIGTKTRFYTYQSHLHCIDQPKRKSPKGVAAQSEIRHLVRLQLKLQFVSNKRNKLRIGGLSLGITDRVAEESLQGIQIAPVPGYLNGMSDCPLHSGWRGLEGFCHLGVQYLGDGIRVPDGPRRGYQELPQNKGFFGVVYCFLCWSMHRCFIGLVALL